MGIYRVKQGETLDQICYNNYGRASGFVEQVLEANYRLSSYMPELPVGLEILLPEIKSELTAQMINLWD